VIAAAARPSLRQALGSLSEPAFRRWFLSQALSASGTMTQGVGQAWLVLKLTGSGVDLGLMTACFFVPLLVGGPWAGTLVDRVDRRRLLITTQILFTVLAGLLAALTATGAALDALRDRGGNRSGKRTGQRSPPGLRVRARRQGTSG
jgi:MFS family permease